MNCRSPLRLAALAVVLIAGLGGLLIAAAPAQTPFPSEAPASVQTAWEKVRQAGAYRFVAEIRQHTFPLATVTNAGQRSRSQAWRLEGETSLIARRMDLTLWTPGLEGVQVRVEGEQAFTRQMDGAWQPLENFGNAFAPQGDFLAFLVAAREIEFAGTETRPSPTSPLQFSRYTFRVDGPAFAAYVRDQLEAQLAEQGELPPGVTLDLPRAYAEMTGSGEVWLDDEGLPRRQILHLKFPPVGEHRTEADVTVDFSDFGLAMSEVGTVHPAFQPALLRRLGEMALMFAALLVGLFVAIHSRSRAVYAALALVLSASLIVTPIAQAAQAASFADWQARTAAEAETPTDAEPIRNEQEFDPLTDPLAIEAQVLASNAAPPTFRTDLCRLADAPLTPASRADSDNDQLSDYQECLLGTEALLADSDGDGLNDGVEVQGFVFAGQVWYTDPLKADTNRDGLGDEQEWLADLNNDGLPDDTDGDNRPDLFDDDNDGDGVRDVIDLSPYQGTARVDDATGAIRTATRVFSDGAPLSILLNGLQPNRPTYVEFQLRPTNPAHLWYAFNVLDWPQGDDAGQMRDVDNQTFADVAAGPTTNTEANGDLKLVPMLEIRITGAPDNLPPRSELEAYGLFTQTVGTSPTVQAAYVPLQLVTDADSGARQAFYGKMLYRSALEWGTAHQVRLAWIVLALVDVCEDEADDGTCLQRTLNQRQVLHVYYDDWFLSGLNVREDHGADIAIIYEDAASGRDTDPNNDAGLIGLATILDHTFVIGRDCRTTSAGQVCDQAAGDGQRDYVVRRTDPNASSRELGEVFDHTRNGGAASLAPWGLPNLLRVETDAYDHLEAALVTTAMTRTRGILETAFNFTTPVTPTLMFAREERARTLNLEEQNLTEAVAWSGAQLNLNVDASPARNRPGGRPVETVAAISWAAYRRVGGVWEALPREAYWNELARRYATPAQIESGAFFGGLLAIGAYYLGLFNGVLNTVQVGERLMIPSTRALIDAELAERLNRFYTAPGGQGVEFTSNFILSVMFPDLPEEQIIRIAEARFSADEFPNVMKTAEFQKYWARSQAAIRTANRLGVASSAIGAIGFSLALFNLGVIITKQAIGAKKDSPLEILNLSLNLAVNTINAISTGLSIAQAIAVKTLALGSRAAAIRSVLGAANLTRANVGGAVIGLIVAIGVTWGVFIHTVVSNNIQTGTPQFNILLAGAIAATLIAILFFVLSLTTVGLILVALIGVIDALLQLLCGVGVRDACTGITAWLTEQLAKLIYGYSAAVTVEVRQTDFGRLDAGLLDPRQGFQAGNTLMLTTSLTTTLAHVDPDDKFYDAATVADVIRYWSESELRTSKFNYAYNARPADAATIWTVEADHTYQRRNEFGLVIFEQLMQRARTPATTLSGQIALIAGINVDPAFLVAAYDLPGVECERWVSYSDCDSKRITGASVNALGIVFDIFPSTLTEFYRLDWARWNQVRDNYVAGSGYYTRSGLYEFGPQRDYDGDGLIARAAGGNDPDDGLWDTDGDGLSDAYELTLAAQGFGLANDDRDTDGDCQIIGVEACLSDGQEIRLGTNPTKLDSDGDGLLDKEETDGWCFNYGATATTNTCRVTRAAGETLVTSDPLLADTDGDGMDDKAERDLHRSDPRRYPYHPRAFNEQPVALATDIGGVNVILTEGQTYVRPQSQLIYTSTVRNHISPALYAQGALTVAVPAALGGQTRTYALDYFGGEERSFRSETTVPSGTPSQNADIANLAFAQLQPDRLEPAYVLSTTESFNLLAEPNHPRQWSVNTAAWGNTFLTAAVEGENRRGSSETDPRRAFVVIRSRRTNQIFARTLDTITNNFIGAGDDVDKFAIDMACATDRTCLVVWPKYIAETSQANHFDLYGAIVRTDGTTLPPFRINPADTSGTHDVRPTVASDGVDFMVAWSRGADFQSNNLWARRIDRDGRLQGEYLTSLNADSFDRRAWLADMVSIGPGPGSTTPRFLLVWNESSGSDMRLFQRILQPDAPGSGPTLVRALNSSTGLTHLQVAYDPGGQFGGLLSYINNPTDEILEVLTLPPVGQAACLRGITASATLGAVLRTAFDRSSQSWIIAHTEKPSGSPNVRVNYFVMAPDCAPRTNPERYETGGIAPDTLGLACGPSECAFTTSVAGQLFHRRFGVQVLQPVGPTLNQSKVDRVRIDSELPGAAFDSAVYTLAAQDSASTFTVGGTASDPNSGAGIGRVEVSTDAGATWQPATGLEAWAFNVTLPAGAGTYNLLVRAIDLLGQAQATPGAATINVIGAAPQLGTAIADDAFVRVAFDEANARWVMPLSGTVTSAGSGVASVEVSLDPNGDGWLPATLSAGVWTISYTLAAFDASGAALTDPSGAYTFSVRATDQVGSTTPPSQTLTRRVRVDAVAPQVRLETIGGQPVGAVAVIADSVALGGVISETSPAGSGVDGLELSFTDRQSAISSPNWQSIPVGPPSGAGVLESTWTFSVPVGLEGFYQIDARGVDVAGNRDERQAAWGQWQGEIDTLAPRLTLSALHLGAGSTARTAYQLTATDLNLTETGLTFAPCAGGGRVLRRYYDSEWYLANSGDPTRLYQFTLLCTRPGQPTDPITATVCDALGHCTSSTLTPPGTATAAADPPPVLDVAIFQPYDASVLTTTDPISVSGGAYGLANLRALTVTVDGNTIATQAWPLDAAITDTAWSTTWTPFGQGAHTFVATLSDWAGRTVASDPMTITLSTGDPTVTLSDTVITLADLITANRADLLGTATDAAGIAAVEVSVNGGPFEPAALTPINPGVAGWRFPWALGSAADGAYAIAVRASNTAGRSAEINASVVVDLTPPDPFDITLSYLDTNGVSQPLAPGQTVGDAQSLIIEWTESTGASGYLVGWTEARTTDAAALTPYASNDQPHSQAAGEARAVYAHVAADDSNGNRTWQTVGPVIVDALNTPDYIIDLGYHGWMETSCAPLGADREINRNAPEAASLNAIQRLYAGWNAEALRLTWTGANWDLDGDLFIYVDTAPGGATTALNPYTATAPVIGLPFAADHLVWVEDGRTASLQRWTGTAWTPVAGWPGGDALGRPYFNLEARLSPPHTDVLLPWALLGDPASLRVVALASEENALQLWAAMPEKNPLNSPRVISPQAAALAVTRFDLTQAIEWSALGAGRCPNAGQFSDADVHVSLSADVAGITAGLLSDDWLTLQPGARLDANLDGVPDVALPVAAPLPLGPGQRITYTLSYANNGSQAAAEVRVALAAFGALQLEGGNVIDLGTLAPGASGTFQFSAQVSAGAGERAAELTAVVSDATHGSFDWLWAVHPVDRDGPGGVSLTTPVDYVRSGPITLDGVAQDASGVREVQITIQPIPTGSTTTRLCPDDTPRDGAWTCAWTVSAAPGVTAYQLRARAVDVWGNIGGEGAPVALILDDTPPTVSVDRAVNNALADNILTPGEFLFTGAVQDNARATGVRACLERETGPACTEVAAQPGNTPVGAWAYALPIFAADGVTETLTLYGRDAAGNVSITPLSYTFEVDNLGPLANVTTYRRAVLLSDYLEGGGPAQPVLAGTVSDANGVQVMTVTMQTPTGALLTLAPDRSGANWSFTPRFANQPSSLGRYTLRVYTQDSVGNVRGFGPFDLRVVEGNTPPTVEAGPDQTTDEGTRVYLAPAVFTDTDSLDRHTATINWGDGSPPESGIVTEASAQAAAMQASKAQSDIRIYLPVIVNAARLETSPPPIPILPVGSGAVSGSHIYADNGRYTVRVCVTDDLGGTGCDTFVVTVNNVAPSVDAGPDRSAIQGEAVTFGGAFTDPGTADTHTIQWDFGDGTTVTGTLTPTHSYTNVGVYTVTLTVTDDDGGVGRDTLQVTARAICEGYPILDDFNRADGGLGPNWTGTLGNAAIQNQQLAASGNGNLFWSEALGSNQAACVTIRQASGELGLLLKASDRRWIAVYYVASRQTVEIVTQVPGQGLSVRASVSKTLNAGDRLAARAQADGIVQVYVNEALVVSASAGGSFANSGGRIGLAFIGAAGARLDDFIGGD